MSHPRRIGDYDPTTYRTPHCRDDNHDGCTGTYSTGCTCPCHASRTGFWTRLRRALAGR